MNEQPSGEATSQSGEGVAQGATNEQPGDVAGAAGSTGLYLALTMLTAAAGLAVEIVAGRMIAPYLGMSPYTWTAIIAVVLAGFSLGHWWGGAIAGWPSHKAARAVGWALLAAAITTAASLVLIRLVAGPVIAAGFGPVPTILVITTLLFFAPSLFVGIPSPVLTKLAIDARPADTARTLGRFYAAGAFGSILGTLLAGYVLIAWLGTVRSLVALSLLYLGMAATLFWHAQQRRSTSLVPPAAAVLLAVALLLPSGLMTAAFRSNCTVESQYYCIRIDDMSQSLGTDARVMVLDHLAHGINVRAEPTALVSPYVVMQNALVETHLPGGGAGMRAFFVGGGAYTLPRAWASSKAGSHVVIAEIDPEVTRLAREQMWLGNPANLAVRHADARAALAAEPAASFNVVVGDAFHDIAVPPHLVTDEFVALVKSRLGPGGVYVMNVVDHGSRPRFALSVAASLRRHFPVVEIWSDATLDAEGKRATFVIAALDRPSPAGAITLGRDETWRRWPDTVVERASAALGAIVLTDDYAPVDRLIGVD